MTKNVKTEKDLEKEYIELRDYFGQENLRIDLQQEIIQENHTDSIFIEESKIRYIKVRATYIPTGKIAFGTTHDNQMENAIEALQKLKEDIKVTNPHH